MRVLIADKLPESSHMELRAAGCEVLYEPDLKGDALGEMLSSKGVEVLVVRSTKVTADIMNAAPALGLIVRAGAGVNTIDVAHAASSGIYVANCPGKNAQAVAELAFGLILSADRQIPNNVRDMRAGKWRKKHYSKARGLHGRTLGLIGLGNIGQAMVVRARAFGMKVVAWSRSLTAEQAHALGVEALESPVEVASRSDVVSVHVALTDATRGFVGRSVLEAMRPEAIFINTSRGPVVDETALLEAMEHRGLRCGLDVFCNEPSAKECDFAPALAQHEMCFGTHHIGASTLQAQEAVANEAARIIKAYKTLGEVPSCVNLSPASAASHTLVVRHHDQVGVLAEVLQVLRAAEINVQEMENTIFKGGLAAVARIRIEGCPCDGTLDKIRNAPHVLAINCLQTHPASGANPEVPEQ